MSKTQCVMHRDRLAVCPPRPQLRPGRAPQGVAPVVGRRAAMWWFIHTMHNACARAYCRRAHANGAEGVAVWFAGVAVEALPSLCGRNDYDRGACVAGAQCNSTWESWRAAAAALVVAVGVWLDRRLG